jgi:predicted lysophospholipase L1 biosynthesis ABC-type transport system permease subunit
VLAVQVFHFPYQFNSIIGLVWISVGIAIVGVAGVIGTRTVLAQPLVETLRHGA